jgi:hypothetical protein
MLKWLFPLKKTYIDENKVRLRKQIQDQMKELVEYGTEDDAVELAKTWNPNATPDQIQEVVTLFRDAKRERGR